MLSRMTPLLRLTTALAAVATLALPAGAEEKQELNLYSARHYDVDLKVYQAFTEKTGIPVNLIEGDADQLIQRIKAEGASSPADVLVTADAGRMTRAADAGLLQAVDDKALTDRVPERFRPENKWFGVTSRARVIFYDKAKGVPEGLTTYESLADPAWKGEICMRSSTSDYSVSLMAEMIDALGEDGALKWAKGLGENLARKPQGSDTDQIKAVAAGECRIAIANSYYWGRLAGSSDQANKDVAAKVGLIFPNQDDRGTHVNTSGAGVAAHAPHREAAVKFIEFLTSPEAQQLFADENNEYPVVEGITVHGPIKDYMTFKASTVPLTVYGKNAEAATRIWDEAGVP